MDTLKQNALRHGGHSVWSIISTVSFDDDNTVAASSARATSCTVCRNDLISLEQRHFHQYYRISSRLAAVLAIKVLDHIVNIGEVNGAFNLTQ